MFQSACGLFSQVFLMRNVRNFGKLFLFLLNDKTWAKLMGKNKRICFVLRLPYTIFVAANTVTSKIITA